MKIAELLQDFRKWLDGDDAVTQTPATTEQLSEWDEFFVKIAREVETVMKREMFTPPGGPTYLPGEYIIYLSKTDDAQWQGRKREGLEEGLRNGLSQRAREMVGDKVLKTDKIALSLSIDGSLEKGQVRVQAVWDDDSPRTEVTARKPRPVPAEPADSEGDQTIIRPKSPQSPLFTVLCSMDGGEAAAHKSHRNRFEIGRGSKDLHVDLKLEGDQEISRKHLLIEKAPDGKFQIECLGRNSVEIDEVELQPGERREIAPGQKIRIGAYELSIGGE